MNTQFSLQIKNPCHENFDNFSLTQNGGHCNSCQKEVIDFTKMNSQEVMNHFRINKVKNTCGRFNNDQLKTYTGNTHKRIETSLMSRFIFVFIALFSLCKVTAQSVKSQAKTLDEKSPNYQEIINQKSITVKGTVNENGIALPGTSIVLEGTTVGVSSDFDGNFEFPEKLKKGDVLVFSYLGMNSKKVVIQDKNSTLNIALEVNLKMDSCVLMGAVAVKKVYTSKRNN